jgi:initiation factor 1A
MQSTQTERMGKVSKKNVANKKAHVEKTKRDLLLKTNDQEYGKLIKPLGDKRFEVFCFDAVTRVGRIRSAVKRTRFNSGDVVLVSFRDTEDVLDGVEKVDIVWLYNAKEVQRMENTNEIPNQNSLASIIDLDMPISENILFTDDVEEINVNIDSI